MIKRRLVQFMTAILYNTNIVSDIPARYINSRFCVPGLNCQHCPAAIAGCPLHMIQAFFGGGWQRIQVRALAWLLLLALALGRIVCGWLCPFGLLQDLVHKIPSPKIKRNSFTRHLSLLKYVLLVVLAVMVPFGFYLQEGRGINMICQDLCPSQPLSNFVLSLFQGHVSGYLVTDYRFIVLVLFIVAAIFIFRPFCRFFCPLGAFYGLFNRFALFPVKVDAKKCVGCNACMRQCLMDCEKVGDRECISCGNCKKVCRFGAISYGGFSRGGVSRETAK